MRRRSLILGVVLLGGYLAVLGVTVGLRDDHVRPLYDGFTPPPSYRWVEPPSFFSSGNVKPTRSPPRSSSGATARPPPASRLPTASSS